jgi:hypothetical protein
MGYIGLLDMGVKIIVINEHYSFLHEKNRPSLPR